ncbi:MAG TPA: hypothetical protein VF322_02530 [Gammaproteobacteria bacterium]
MSIITRWLSLVPLRRTAATDKRSRTRTEATAPTPRPRTYEAVELRSRGRACQAARELMGRRMLVEEAPPLPLKGCALRCACYYKQHADRRRDEPRRKADVGITSSFYVGPERRSGLDRRAGKRPPLEDDYYDYMRRRPTRDLQQPPNEESHQKRRSHPD